MNTYSLLTTALNAILVNKFRSFLTMLGVVIGVASVILLISIGSGIKSFVTEQFEGLGSNLITVLPGEVEFGHGGAASATPVGGILSSKLESRDVDLILSRTRKIESANGIIQFSSPVKFGGESKVYFIVGSGEQYPAVRNIAIEKGEFFTKADVDSGRRVAVIGSSVSEKLFLGRPSLGESIFVGDFRFVVTGVLEATGAFGGQNVDEQVIIPLTAAERILGRGNLAYIQVKALSAESLETAKIEVEQALLTRLKKEDFTVVDQESVLSVVSSVLTTLTLGLGGIAAISLVVGGIGIMNIMLVTVVERTHEIGLRKAVGATPRIILLQFLAESIFLSLSGGFIGFLLGFLGSLVVGRFIKTEVTWWAVVLAFGVAVAVGVVFGILPARRAAKLSPIEALRYE